VDTDVFAGGDAFFEFGIDFVGEGLLRLEFDAVGYRTGC
jgi:hypothetical protein